jgi:hypothetical protein
MPEKPVERQTTDSGMSTPLPTTDEVSSALAKVARGQVPAAERPSETAKKNLENDESDDSLQ